MAGDNADIAEGFREIPIEITEVEEERQGDEGPRGGRRSRRGQQPWAARRPDLPHQHRRGAGRERERVAAERAGRFSVRAMCVCAPQRDRGGARECARRENMQDAMVVRVWRGCFPRTAAR